MFPAEAYAEKEGTLTHPDGRLQRLRPAIGHPGEVRMEWQVLLDLAAGSASTAELPLTAGAVFAELAEAVPFYRGLTLDEIGGDGLRWPEREESRDGGAGRRSATLGFAAPADPPAPLEPADGILRLAPRPGAVGVVGHRALALAALPRGPSRCSS